MNKVNANVVYPLTSYNILLEYLQARLLSVFLAQIYTTNFFKWYNFPLTNALSEKDLEDYARKNGYSNLWFYTDDSYSGVSFERLGFQEMLFPQKGVRFIAINDNVDSHNEDMDNDFTPLRN